VCVWSLAFFVELIITEFFCVCEIVYLQDFES